MKKREALKVSPDEALLQINKKHIQIKTLIQDISNCRESMEELNIYNEMGRCMLAVLREAIEELEAYAKALNMQRLMADMRCHKIQLATNIREFKNANLKSLQAIEAAQRADLLTKASTRDETALRNRNIDNTGLVKMSTEVTDQLLSISRHLADTNQKSADTLDNLVSSSTTVHGTQSELQNTAGTISQSSKLLKKYGRREFTDKIIMFFAFLFFIAVCLYIVQKRMF